jgi:hypothetical protein
MGPRSLVAVWGKQLQQLGGVEGGFDGGVDFGLGEFGGYADAVHDRLLIRRPVAYDADSADAQQGGPAVFGVVEAFFEVAKGFAGEQGAYL